MIRTDRPHALAVGVWAVFVVASVALAAQPGDPGAIPAHWLLILAVLGVLAFLGNRTAYAALVVLNVVLLGTALLLALPVPAALWAWYGLVGAALGALVGIPLLARRVAVGPTT
ncbi:hypothetical protein [Blastococcus xanthinilyticus]|uniref:Uncharacterized protein n=1 Tax=Blastococcus xanthinilyticus TaxID=1564164 RepID=A0A5S5CQH6_9ACTN|nr:hypothetical protein [Blastococcus xanthinilyticus]TYP83782.1 hypothetical protein BD833_11522 [Blastococcus xanthinilyticus]